MTDDPLRRWCVEMAARSPSQIIRPHGAPYLTRYFLAGWNPITKRPGPSVFLHHFVGSDPNDSVHSHPWAFACSYILVGGYLEYRCLEDGRAESRVYLPGSVNVLRGGDRHRIDLLERECWTLFLTGASVQTWGFVPLCGVVETGA
jgi:hypothetical protein